MRATESASFENTRTFSQLFNESEYIRFSSRCHLFTWDISSMKIFDEIADVPAGCHRAAHLANVNRVKPTRQFRQGPRQEPERPCQSIHLALSRSRTG